MRPPEVFVRPLSHEEAVRLKRLSKRAKHAVDAAAGGDRCWRSNVGCRRRRSRRCGTTDPSCAQGDPRVQRAGVRFVCALATGAGDPAGSRLSSVSGSSRGRCPSRHPGGAVDALVAAAAVRAIWPSRGSWCRPRHLGAVLAEAGLSFQRTRTWKASPDPDYEAKAARVLELTRAAAADGVVISFDQMGPVSLRPTPGRGLGAAEAGPSASARLQPPPRHPLRLRRLRRPRRPAPGQAARQAPPAATCSPSCARSGSATRPGSGSTGSRTTSPPTGSPTSAPSPPPTASSSSPTPTYASYLNPVECHFSARSASSSSPTPTTSTGTPSRYALARHVRYRNGDHRDRRLAAAEHRHRIAA